MKENQKQKRNRNTHKDEKCNADVFREMIQVWGYFVVLEVKNQR